MDISRNLLNRAVAGGAEDIDIFLSCTECIAEARKGGAIDGGDGVV